MSYAHMFIILLPAALGELVPDVHFDEQNDRFDLTPLVQQGVYDQWNDFVNDMRRSHRYYKNIKDLALDKSYERDTNQYERFMTKAGRRDLVSYLHGEPVGDSPETRRSEALVDKEVLMHHAVPIVLKVEGIMIPLDEN